MFGGISKRELIEKLLAMAKEKFEQKKCLTYHFDSKAIQIFKDELSFAKGRK